MDQATDSKIVSFLWGIADDVLRDLFRRGKYPDVILPMCVLRRLDSVLEPTQKAVVETKEMLDQARITEQRAALCLGAKVSAVDLKLILRMVSWRVECAPPVVAKVHKPNKTQLDQFHGFYEQPIAGKRCVVEYEPDPDLRDTEQVPLLEPGGIEGFFRREVLPHVPDAWIDPGSIKTGYEISFTRYFYQPKPLRTLEEIRADVLAVEKESEGLLDELLKGSVQ